VAERTHELSQLNQALTEAKSRAEAVSQSKTRFLAAVSHDLMQPLNAARLFSAALSQQAEGMNEEARQLVQHMDSSLRSAEELISDLLDISRLENGKITPTPSPCPQRAVRHPRGRIQAAGGRKGLEFRLRGSRLRVDSDMKLLRRVLQNFSPTPCAMARARSCWACAARASGCGWRCGTAARASPTTSCR
jgi:signal transduction histidine kinase